MNEKVYLLWFVQERDDCDDCELLIGVYSSEKGFRYTHTN